MHRHVTVQDILNASSDSDIRSIFSNLETDSHAPDTYDDFYSPFDIYSMKPALDQQFSSIYQELLNDDLFAKLDYIYQLIRQDQLRKQTYYADQLKNFFSRTTTMLHAHRELAFVKDTVLFDIFNYQKHSPYTYLFLLKSKQYLQGTVDWYMLSFKKHDTRIQQSNVSAYFKRLDLEQHLLLLCYYQINRRGTAFVSTEEINFLCRLFICSRDVFNQCSLILQQNDDSVQSLRSLLEGDVSIPSQLYSLMLHAMNDPLEDEAGVKLQPWKKSYYKDSYHLFQRDMDQDSFAWYMKTIWKSITSVSIMQKALTDQRRKSICADCGIYLNLINLKKSAFWRPKYHSEVRPRSYKYYGEFQQMIECRFNNGVFQYQYCQKCFERPLGKEHGRLQKTGYDIYEREFQQPDELVPVKTRREFHAIMIGKVSSFITDRSSKHDYIQSYPSLRGHMSSYLHDGRLGAYWQDLFGERKPWWDNLHHLTNEKQHVSTALDYLRQNNHLYKLHYSNYELLVLLSANPLLASTLEKFKDDKDTKLYKVVKPGSRGPHTDEIQMVLNDGDVTYLLPVDLNLNDPLSIEHDLKVQSTAVQVGDKAEIDKLLSVYSVDRVNDPDYQNLITQIDSLQMDKDILKTFHRNQLFYSHPYIEEFLFPTLYPQGRGGFNNSYLHLQHDLSQYIKMRLLSCRIEFRKCIEWIFWMLDRLQKERLISYSKVPMIIPANYDSSSQLRDLMEADQKTFYSIFGKHLSRKMNDSKKYYFQKYHALRKLISHFKRAPDLFLTLAMNEQDPLYTELRSSYSRNPQKPVLTKKDPLLGVAHFYIKVRTALKIAFDKQYGFFGTIEGKFEKLEVTERGSPHVHILLWVDEVTRKRFDDGFIVQAVVPEDGLLRERVLKYQIHRCVPDRCYKNTEQRICRSGFPFSQCLRDSMVNNRWVYRRGPIDSWVTPYNPLLLLLFDGNHCLLRMTQSDCTQYMLKYVAKTNTTVDLLIGNKNAVRDKNEVVEYLTTRVVHVQQAIWQMLNLPMIITKPMVVYVDVSLPSRQIRKLKNPSKLRPLESSDDEGSQQDIRDYLESNEGGLGEDWENLFDEGLLQRYYSRPYLYDWDSMTFKQFVEMGSYTTVKDRIPKYLLPTQDSPAKYQELLVKGKRIYYFLKKTRVLSQFKKFWPEQGDVYFYSMILQRFPHRDSDIFHRDNKSKSYMEECFLRELIKTSDYDTVDEAKAFWKTTPCNRMMMYDMFTKMLIDPTLSQIKRERFEVHKDALNDLIEDDVIFDNVQGENPERLQPMHSQLVQDFLGQVYKSDEDQMREIIRSTGYNPLVVPVLINDLLTSMTEQIMSDSQKAVISYIHHTIHYLGDQLLLFITGGAGTGKSRLVEWIRVMIEHVLFKKLDVTASTGQAAANISGITIHSLLQLRDSMTEAWIDPDSPFQRKLELIDVVLIDEVSMLDAATFELINDVLQKAHVTDRERKVKPFGGKHMIIVGDLMQLLPFKEYDSDRPKNIIVTSESFKKFNWIMLQSNFRQTNDQVYGAVLNRIRFGVHTSDDVSFLKSLETAESLCIDPKAMFLCSTNAQKKTYNNMVIQRIFGSSSQEIVINSVDQEVTTADDFPQIFDGSSNTHDLVQQLNAIFEKDLLQCLQLRKGMRVMLTRNLMVSMFQTNGTLASILEVSPNKEFITIYNETKGLRNPVQHIGKICLSASVNGRHFTRLQFPVVPAYSSTVHKAQGQTLDCVYADFKNIFAYGQVYTMLSRVRSQNDIRILHFDETAIKSSEYLTQIYDSKVDQSDNLHKNYLLDEILRNSINAIISAYQKHPPQSKELIQKIRERMAIESSLTLMNVLPPMSQESQQQEAPKKEEGKVQAQEVVESVPVQLVKESDDDVVMIDGGDWRQQKWPANQF